MSRPRAKLVGSFPGCPVISALEAWGRQHVRCGNGEKTIIPPVTEAAA